MCDIECRKRFIRLEISVAKIATDITWVKKIVGVTCVAVAGVYGLDIAGVV